MWEPSCTAPADAIRTGPRRRAGCSGGPGGTLLSLAQQVNAVCGDLQRFPITYYFHPTDREPALPVALPDFLPLPRERQQYGSPAVRLQSNLLLKAIQVLAVNVGKPFLDRCDADVDALLAAYAEDHS
jgi:hypothetical protein